MNRKLSQTKVINDVRLKQGEINLMGGLMQVEYDKTVSGVPGLGNIPVLRRLFTSETNTTKESELVIVLIPHIIRAVDITDTNLKTIDSGNSTTFKIHYASPKPQSRPLRNRKRAQHRLVQLLHHLPNPGLDSGRYHAAAGSAGRRHADRRGAAQGAPGQERGYRGFQA